MPSILLIVWCFVPICHEEEGLNKGFTVDFIVEVIEHLEDGQNDSKERELLSYPGFLEECFSCGLSIRVPRAPQHVHIHERRARKHYRLEQ